VAPHVGLDRHEMPADPKNRDPGHAYRTGHEALRGGDEDRVAGCAVVSLGELSCHTKGRFDSRAIDTLPQPDRLVKIMPSVKWACAGFEVLDTD
jgi:hypothetical protein